MALRIVREVNDDILLKKSRPVAKVDKRILQLLDDMVETMRYHEGVGLAGPQVGVLRRVFVAEVDNKVYKIINPEFVEMNGEHIGIEGCLSIPNFRATVKRAKKVKMKYIDVQGNEQIIEADGLLAKCFQHESDHLDGILITSKYLEKVTEENIEELTKKYKLDN